MLDKLCIGFQFRVGLLLTYSHQVGNVRNLGLVNGLMGEERVVLFKATFGQKYLTDVLDVHSLCSHFACLLASFSWIFEYPKHF